MLQADDFRAKLPESGLDALVTAVDVPDLLDERHAPRRQTRGNQPRARADVRRLDARALKCRDPLDCGAVRLVRDLGAQAKHVVDEDEAVLEYALPDVTDTARKGKCSNELGLEVCGEARVGIGDEAHRLDDLRRLEAHAAVDERHARAHFLELEQGHREVLVVDAQDFDAAARAHGRAKVGSGFEPVADGVEIRAVQSFDAVDDDFGAAVEGNFGAHGVEQAGKVGNFGVLRGVVKGCATAG